jgi:hypothetical protein
MEQKPDSVKKTSILSDTEIEKIKQEELLRKVKILCPIVFLKHSLLIEVSNMRNHWQKEHSSCRFGKAEYLFSSPPMEMSLNQGQWGFYFLLLVKNQRHKKRLSCPQNMSVYILKKFLHLF